MKPIPGLVIPKNTPPPGQARPKKEGNLTQILRERLGDGDHKAQIAQRMIDIAKDPAAKASDSIAAAKLIFERLEGAPKTNIELQVEANPLSMMDREGLEVMLAAHGLRPVTDNALFLIEAEVEAESR